MKIQIGEATVTCFRAQNPFAPESKPQIEVLSGPLTLSFPDSKPAEAQSVLPYLLAAPARHTGNRWNYAMAALLLAIALYFAGRIGAAFVSGDVRHALTRQERAIQQCSGIHDQLLRSYCIAAAEQDGGR